MRDLCPLPPARVFPGCEEADGDVCDACDFFVSGVLGVPGSCFCGPAVFSFAIPLALSVENAIVACSKRFYAMLLAILVHKMLVRVSSPLPYCQERALHQ